MIFQGVNRLSFANTLTNILNELQEYKGKHGITYYVQKRLDESLAQYYKEVNSSLSFLQDSNRNLIRLSKQLNKEEI